jgi:hypothetical protein
MSRKFQKYSVGGVLQIPLGDGWHTYGQMTGDAEVAFFDAKSKTDLTVEEVVTRPVLFRFGVDSYTITKFIWLKIGKAPLSDELKTPQKMYIQDALCPDKFEIYCAGEIRPATREECEGLECCAVWSPEQAVDRINDFYNKVPNRWTNSLQIKNAI